MTAFDIPNVSRETMERLEIYATLLRKWNPKINLVAKSTIDDVWERHILDSVQVFQAADRAFASWADLGSGGGFPGLVVAILASGLNSTTKINLVESDQRKCAFLRTVIRETGANATVYSKRIESLASLNADIVSARALSELGNLCAFAARHMRQDGLALFPKGRNWKSEVETARENWEFDFEAVPSNTDSESVILRIKDLKRV